MSFSNKFGPGYAGVIDGSQLDKALAYMYGIGTMSYANGITALAGGGRTGAPTVSEFLTSVDTVTSGNDSIQLPAALPGSVFVIQNNTATSMQVFANGSDTINGTAGATGVAQAGNKGAVYWCPKKGVWFRILSA